MTQAYNAPPASASSIGPQIRTDFYIKKALIEADKEKYFSQLADVTSMPKHHGKKIKRFHYIPMLDDANLNDQGIDAAGVTISASSYSVTMPLVSTFTVEADATAAAAAVNAVEAGTAVKSGSASPWTVTVSKRVSKFTTDVLSAAVVAALPGSFRAQGSGNLYGSSKDVGTISGKLPTLGEHGGRVNRVGFKRKELEGTFEKFGFFDEYTQESLDFDTDEELDQHVHREMIRGAHEITEDALQIDLLSSAGVVVYAGAATSNAGMDATSLVTYGDLMRTSILLDNNLTPKYTKMITGTRFVDTKVIPGARVAYIGSELLPTLRAMKDLHNEPAFIPVERYAAGGNVLRGEVGSIDAMRFVVVPEMMKWAGEGAPVGNNTDTYETNGRFDVFPILIVGAESFTTIGFQTDGKSVNFKILHKKPGEATADKNDPYGETGFMSIKWYYGFMALRPERLALIKTVAKL
ncbi:N4-gp56 family major capsid protein [Xenophilus sp. Marseille-Q4582]|uniref:N4-gp56 family major capsid protein n=1 Tax=Xenophilus sp. Marseille-Q4582 TaxID=2866600 RepID=UPI001CE4AF0B|nr:N4-gp56 family major capsid protein [Xenophilus sp. Marseille-Q4582]